MRLGIIDVGTNSTHLIIGDVHPKGSFHVLAGRHDLTRLGQGAWVTGMLTQGAMHRTLEALRRYARVLARWGADHIEAVATSAVREARNGPMFVRRVRKTLKLPLRVASGREEARLIYAGVQQARQFRQAVIIVAIGGGSAQVVCGKGADLRYATSVRLGAARLTQRFITHDPASLTEIDALSRAVERAWSPVARRVRGFRWNRALGSSAMIDQLMRAAPSFARRRGRHQRPHSSLSLRTLRRLVGWLCTSTRAQRRRLPGLDSRREGLVLAAAVTLFVWMKRCGVTRLEWAPGSLREGLATACFARRRKDQAHAIDRSRNPHGAKGLQLRRSCRMSAEGSAVGSRGVTRSLRRVSRGGRVSRRRAASLSSRLGAAVSPNASVER